MIAERDILDWEVVREVVLVSSGMSIDVDGFCSCCLGRKRAEVHSSDFFSFIAKSLSLLKSLAEFTNPGSLFIKSSLVEAMGIDISWTFSIGSERSLGRNSGVPSGVYCETWDEA